MGARAAGGPCGWGRCGVLWRHFGCFCAAAAAAAVAAAAAAAAASPAESAAAAAAATDAQELLSQEAPPYPRFGSSSSSRLQPAADVPLLHAGAPSPLLSGPPTPQRAPPLSGYPGAPPPLVSGGPPGPPLPGYPGAPPLLAAGAPLGAPLPAQPMGAPLAAGAPPAVLYPGPGSQAVGAPPARADRGAPPGAPWGAPQGGPSGGPLGGPWEGGPWGAPLEGEEASTTATADLLPPRLQLRGLLGLLSSAALLLLLLLEPPSRGGQLLGSAAAGLGLVAALEFFANLRSHNLLLQQFARAQQLLQRSKQPSLRRNIIKDNLRAARGAPRGPREAAAAAPFCCCCGASGSLRSCPS
ncbi:hypothetical protein, conserved [Eimeria necatrix]|uniref:Uncharacterized protein n=1 Tax=Eimeria necatrix TaxID=51315 RepID=U6MR17_9EIME|nr:hypothetical protein, conserved [Eimeria necatrix]CDJ66471.1 hypothetical protein, conserved [Eimeria necatrix]